MCMTIGWGLFVYFTKDHSLIIDQDEVIAIIHSDGDAKRAIATL
ncbi:hypothetical protein ACE38F_22270 [Bacillus mycoides]